MIKNVLTQGWQYNVYAKGLGVALAVLLVGFGSYYTYHYVSSSREQAAYKALAESYDFFDQAVASDNGKDKEKNMHVWRDVEVSFKTGYELNKNSSLAPYFLAFQAETQIRQGELEKAVTTMDHMMSALKKDSPLFALYSVKRALMKMDVSDENIKGQGLEELIALANEEVNPNRDMALYYLGEYYWSKDDYAKAHVAWRYLKDMESQGKSPTPSPWFDLVKSRVEDLA